MDIGIGERIKKRRLELGWSQRELARRMGYKDNSTLARIEKGTVDVYQNKIVQFATILKTTPAYLMGWEDEETFTKKEDAITDILIKARRNEDLLEAIKDLCDLSDDYLPSIKAFLSLLKQQHINDTK